MFSILTALESKYFIKSHQPKIKMAWTSFEAHSRFIFRVLLIIATLYR